MPVTAKLSKRFYEALGEKPGELNFARFDAKLEQRLAELRGELLTEIQRLRADMVRWMFGFWVTTVLMLGGLMVALRAP